jgi:hypothetical protein
MTVSTTLPVPGQVKSMSQAPTAIKQSIYETSTTMNHRIGDKLELGDGRIFHYCRNGLVALTQGKLLQQAVTLPNYFHQAVQTTAVIGNTYVLVTAGATVVVANYFAEGTIHIDDATYGGYYYKVANHLACAGSATLQINLYDPILTAFTTAATYTLTKNPYDYVIIEPNAAVTGIPVGVSLIPVAASTASVPVYFWAQTYGPCSVLTQGTVVLGQKVGWGGTADGAVGPVAAATTATVGYAMQANATLGYSLIYLRIAS